MNDIPTRPPVLNQIFQHYLSDENSARFVSAVAQSYTNGTLERLAEYGDRLARRAATMALGFLAGYESNDVLGRRMNDDDRGVRLLAENGIRDLWCRDGNDSHRQKIQAILRLNRAHDFEAAIRWSTELIEEAPWFAEAWNQRAIAYYHLSRYVDSANDCHQTLELNPYHYAAAVGMAHCYLEMDDARAALECFRRALRLNPDLEDVRTRVTLLRQAFEET